MEGDLKHAWDTGLTMVDTPGAGTPEILLGNLFEQREVVVGRSRGKLAECDTFPFIINFYLIKGNVFQFMTIDHVATEGEEDPRIFTVSHANARFAHPSISTPSRPIQGGLPLCAQGKFTRKFTRGMNVQMGKWRTLDHTLS